MAKRSINYKDMSDRQKLEYRRRRRLRRRIQVYVELGAIGLVLLLVVVFIFNQMHGTSDSNDSINITSTKDDEPSLKISNPDTYNDNDSETVVEEPDTEETLEYTAVSNDNTQYISTESVVSPYAILINADTGIVVGQKNDSEQIYPASMTKIMTVLVAAENIDSDKLSDSVEMSHEAVDFAYANDCSTSGFQEGEVVTVKDLFYGTILPSGGDAAIQLAMYTAGDTDSFVELMNEECEKLGISDSTHFSNPVGVYSDDNYSTCHDIGIILMAALNNDVCKEVLSTKVYDSSATSLNPSGITISNWFLRRIEDYDIGGTILGAKTGYVVESGSCAASSMISGSGTTFICVTAGSSSSWRCIYDHIDIYNAYAN